MSAIATAIVGSAVVGGVVASKAAKGAAKTQSEAAQLASDTTLQATRESNDLQWQMYQQGLRNQQPYLQGGQTAYAALLGGMGLGAPQGPSAAPQLGGGQPTLTNAQGQTTDMQGNPVAPTESRYGGVQNYGASPEQMAAAAAGQVNEQGAGRFTETFAPSDLTNDPSYKWRLEQGLQALKASRAATGSLQTGQGLKDITNYAQGAASQEYQSAYDRFMRNQETAYGRLAGLAGIGSTTAGNIATQGGQVGSNIAANTMAGTGASTGYLTGGAAANAAGQVGAANAWSGAMQGGVNNWMGYQYLNRPTTGPVVGYGITPGFQGVGNTGLTGPG